MPGFWIPLGAGKKILGGEHTAGSENADQSVEGFLGFDALFESWPALPTGRRGGRGSFEPSVGSEAHQSLSPEEPHDAWSRQIEVRNELLFS